MDEGFTATVYPNVQENLKLTADEPVIPEEPASSTGTLSSLQHLAKDFSFGDQFFNDKPSEADNEKTTADTEAESMVSVTIHQDTSAIPPMTSPVIDLVSRPDSPNVHRPLPTTATATATTTTTITTLPLPPQPQQEGKIINNGSRLYKLENQDIPNQVRKAMDEIVMDAVDWAMQAPLRECFRDLPEADMKEILHNGLWNQIPHLNHEDHMMLYEALEKLMAYDDTIADEQAYSSGAEDIGHDHIPTASALKSTYAPPPENLLLAQIDDMATFMDCYCKKQGIYELTQKDLEGLAYEIVKVFHPDIGRPALSISKMKAAHYLNAGLEQMVPGQMWIEEECKYDIAVINLVIRQHVEDFQLGIESYQTQLNLTKPRWDATGFEYKHDFTVIDSPRAVTFRDKYGVQMIMSFNEIHKFSDGTLQQINEALDYRVKEFRVNRMNSGLDTRFWMKKDVDRSKEFMFAIQKRLKTRRILRNLESFVGGRIREGDYRLLKRTE
ncbi:hypothetical protein Tco_0366464 [Tanacetum coccineum]